MKYLERYKKGEDAESLLGQADIEMEYLRSLLYGTMSDMAERVLRGELDSDGPRRPGPTTGPWKVEPKK